MIFLHFGVDFWRNASRIAQPGCTWPGNNKKKKAENMMKTIAIVLSLTALTATGNTLPPTPEAPVAEYAI